MIKRLASLLLVLCLLLPVCVGAEENNDTGNENNSITLSFIGDCSIGDAYQYREYGEGYHVTIREKGYAWPFSLVKEILEADDLTVANLEVLLTERTKKKPTVKFPLRGDPSHVQVLKEGSIEVVNTVNNHSMDFYTDGYMDTLQVLDDAGIYNFGFSKKSFERIAVVEVKGIKIAFLGYSYPQTYHKEIIRNNIEKLKGEQGCDLVIVSLHWGTETNPSPKSGQMKYAKAILDAGADAIYGHHPHVTQPIHFYNGKPILYSTGNFTFGTISSKLDPNTDIFQMTFEKTDAGVVFTRLKVIPCKTQGNADFRPMILTNPEEIQANYKRLYFKKQTAGMQGLPESFMETGIVNMVDGMPVE